MRARDSRGTLEKQTSFSGKLGAYCGIAVALVEAFVDQDSLLRTWIGGVGCESGAYLRTA
eukprot:6172874-Pleurochrysis_carterae.AAC.2